MDKVCGYPNNSVNISSIGIDYRARQILHIGHRLVLRQGDQWLSIHCPVWDR